MKNLRIVFMLLFVLVPFVQSQAQVGLTVGTEYGIGGLARIGTERIIVEAGAGLAPLFVFVTGVDELEFYFPFTVGAKLSIAASKPESPNRFGVKFGVSYNGILKTGFGGGVDYEVSQNPSIVLAGGIMYFPDAKQGVTDHYFEDTGNAAAFEESLAIQPMLSISIIFGK